MNSFEKKRKAISAEGSLTLSAGALRLELSPSIGGAISAFEWTEGDAPRPILRESPHPFQQVLDAACFPLVPYVNRIRGGQFSFRGRTVRIAPNMAGDPSPLHGQGWLNPWTVEEANGGRAVLTYDHKAGEWPWEYHARQELRLEETGLSVRLSCTNRSAEPMPCGLGFHPYFPCSRGTILDTGVEVAWTIDEKVLPVEKVAAEGRFDLSGRTICGQDLDHGFGGWSGEARISDPDWPYTLTLRSPDAGFFQVYSPPRGGLFVAEPVTHANAALNARESEWPALGMRVLAPGETMDVSMHIDVHPG